MTGMHDDQDRAFDELLRELGPHVPHPELTGEARARLLAILEGAAPRRRFRSALLAVSALAALLAIACGVLLAWGSRTSGQLAESRWETGEALSLFITARRTQPVIPVPDDIEGVRSDDLLLIAFHHDLCPLARVCTPRFQELAARHRGEPERFETFDVTGERRDQVARELDAMGLDFALFGPAGAETGVVKVVDLERRRLLSSAPGIAGVEQAESLLRRVASAE